MKIKLLCIEGIIIFLCAGLAPLKAQQTEIQRLEEEIHRTKHHALSVELTTTSRQPNIRRIAKKVAKKAKSREKKLQRYLKSDDRVEKPKKGWEMKLEFGEMPRSGQIVVNFQNINYQYGDDPVLFNNLKGTITHGQRIALSGRRGSKDFWAEEL